jgi:DNA-binding MarR family transcriptional regulator
MNDEEPLVAASTMRRGATRLSRRMRLARGEGGLTQQEFSVLAHLRRDGSSTPGDLAAAERIQPQSLTRTLTSLENEGLITREAHPLDGRSSLLAVTEEGLRVFYDDLRRRDLWLASAMSSQLTATERELLRLAGELMIRLAASESAGPERAGADEATGRAAGRRSSRGVDQEAAD